MRTTVFAGILLALFGAFAGEQASVAPASPPTYSVASDAPIKVAIDPESPIAGMPFSISIDSPLRTIAVRLPDATFKVGDKTIAFRDAVKSGDGWHYSGSWPIAGTFDGEVVATYAEQVPTQDLAGNDVTVAVLRELSVPIHITLSAITPPEPPKPPDPPQPPTPVPSKLRVLIIEESSNRAPEVAAIIGSKRLDEYCKTHCGKSDGKTPDIRIVDRDTPADVLPEPWRSDFLAKKDDPPPVIVVANETVRVGGPLPLNWPALYDLLSKYGGK